MRNILKFKISMKDAEISNISAESFTIFFRGKSYNKLSPAAPHRALPPAEGLRSQQPCPSADTSSTVPGLTQDAQLSRRCHVARSQWPLCAWYRKQRALSSHISLPLQKPPTSVMVLVLKGLSYNWNINEVEENRKEKAKTTLLQIW